MTVVNQSRCGSGRTSISSLGCFASLCSRRWVVLVVFFAFVFIERVKTSTLQGKVRRNKLSLQGTKSSSYAHFWNTHLNRREVVVNCWDSSMSSRFHFVGCIVLLKSDRLTVVVDSYLGFFGTNWENILCVYGKRSLIGALLRLHKLQTSSADILQTVCWHSADNL